ncbi:TonB-dependent hemoglobin/transferrin/lactoferrin family receptor [Rhodocyclus gracilis]|uniref:TonB-dependent hemoglobin/transferrin/lactoferrin family receptor n=1 Tax=Rhodocyclus tenuis TaxID=1066 RepID=A0A6L5JS45_RHOTE|nr:TonB-dependent hemoglobin/transferrin/lactoferrin family receptor [Rhodocyclus gracilis]MQY50267.1 TonB-dependent hemoglobin/transferrin/lactoferrin family receptor [Rhodocyclus gracilis]
MFPFRKRSLALLVAMTCNAVQAEENLPLRDVVVTATRSAADIDSIPATVTGIDRKTLDRRLPADEADLFKDEGDIAFARDLRRHGATRVNIRGIDDNRVVQMIDGVRIGDYYNGGGPTNFTVSASPTVMPDFLKRVEIVRGAASSLYGSDAIGGVVGYVTLNPADLLEDGATRAARLRAGYNGNNNSVSQTVLGALRSEGATPNELLVGYSHAKGDEFSSRGDIDETSKYRTKPNPTSTEDNGALAKLILRPATGHKISAMLEGRDQTTTTDLKRLAGSLPRVTWAHGDDQGRRVRGSLEWEHTPENVAWYDRLTARLYYQETETRNHNFQRRTGTTSGCSAVSAGSNNCYIENDYNVDQTHSGATLQLEKTLKTGDISHLLTYGADFARVRTEEMRDGRIWNQTTGTFTKTLAGETYPLRDFANGTTDTLGLFVQDEISNLAGGKLSLTPGLRYDRTQLKPDVDALAQKTLTQLGRQAAEQTHGSFSPKLGAIWRFDPVLSGFGQITRGFRAPNYNEVNGAFRNSAQSYATAPNPDLKPETSVGVELGLRVTTRTLRSQLSVFDNRYKDFIENVRLNCPGDSRCISGLATTYTAVNRSKVRIYGAELRSAWDFAPGWSTSGSLTYAHGTNEDTGQPLNSVEPLRLTASLLRDFGTWGAEGRVRAAAHKSRIDESSAQWFHPPGYAVSDLSLWWKLDRKTQLTVAVNNVFDKKYWLWSDIRQADDSNPLGVAFYSQPGRTLSVALQADF